MDKLLDFPGGSLTAQESLGYTKSDDQLKSDISSEDVSPDPGLDLSAASMVDGCDANLTKEGSFELKGLFLQLSNQVKNMESAVVTLVNTRLGKLESQVTRQLHELKHAINTHIDKQGVDLAMQIALNAGDAGICDILYQSPFLCKHEELIKDRLSVTGNLLDTLYVQGVLDKSHQQLIMSEKRELGKIKRLLMTVDRSKRVEDLIIALLENELSVNRVLGKILKEDYSTHRSADDTSNLSKANMRDKSLYT